MPDKRFDSGQVVATATLMAITLEYCGTEEAQDTLLFGLFQRHISGDWGDMTEDDKQANEDALR